MSKKLEASVESASVLNGNVFSFEVNGDKEILVYERADEYEETECESWCNFLYQLTERFYGCSNKYATDLTNVKILPSPGRDADTEHHVKVFVNDMFFEPRASLVKEITELIDAYNEKELEGK